MSKDSIDLSNELNKLQEDFLNLEIKDFYDYVENYIFNYFLANYLDKELETKESCIRLAMLGEIYSICSLLLAEKENCSGLTFKESKELGDKAYHKLKKVYDVIEDMRKNNINKKDF